MRTFNYLKDYNLLTSSVPGYLTQLSLELDYLIKTSNNKEIYYPLYKKLQEFSTKYPNLRNISIKIREDLLKEENVSYYFKNGKYPSNASIIGNEITKDLNELFTLEESLKNYTALLWQQRLTNFNDLVNGEDFMIVGHASFNIPGISSDKNYNSHMAQYLSCSLFSNLELNSFQNSNLIFVVDVNSTNYIASSSCDSVTGDFNNPDFLTLKVIEVDGSKHYIKVGYTNDSKKCVTALETPEMIEKLSIARELKENGKLYDYNSSLCNEVVLDRTKTSYSGAVLLSNGCDILFNEYLLLKENNIPFKCINKALYRLKKEMLPYSNTDYEEYLSSLKRLETRILAGLIPLDKLNAYYNEVIIPMQYDDIVVNDFKKVIAKYTKIKGI